MLEIERRSRRTRRVYIDYNPNTPHIVSAFITATVLHMNGTLGTRTGIGFGDGTNNAPIDTPADTVDVRVALVGARMPGTVP